VLLILAMMADQSPIYTDSVHAVSGTRKVVTHAVRDLYKDIDHIPNRVKEMRNAEMRMHGMFARHRVATYTGDKRNIVIEFMRAMECLKEVMLHVFVIAVKIKG
jgi:hypothetical protein